MKTIGIILAICALIIGLYFFVIWVDHQVTNWCILDYPREIIGGNVTYLDDSTDYTLDFKGYGRHDGVTCFGRVYVDEKEYQQWLNQRGSD